MQNIDEARLEDDLAYRFGFVAEFIGFGADDIAAIHGVAEQLAPLAGSLVDAVYVKLFEYDATKRHFVPRQSGYDGDVPPTIDELTLDHPQIAFRKGHLGTYLGRLITNPYDDNMVAYLDLVGKIHTPKSGSAKLDVPYIQMNALLGFVSDALIATILSFNLDRETEVATVRAFNKLLWIQSDLIGRHYVTQ